MPDEEGTLDVNEAFEKLLLAEEIAKDSGYSDGYEAGRTRLVNGYHLGYHRASVLAAQLGFYAGVIEQYLSKPQNSKKAEILAKEVLEEIYKFPRHNDENVDIEQRLENIKFKYVRFCSLGKIHSAYPEAEKLDF